MKTIIPAAAAVRLAAAYARLAALLACVPLAGHGAEAEVVRVQFREVETIFANPGQGWMSQQRSPRSEPRFPCAVVYVRFNWADAEPAPGSSCGNWRIKGPSSAAPH